MRTCEQYVASGLLRLYRVAGGTTARRFAAYDNAALRLAAGHGADWLLPLCPLSGGVPVHTASNVLHAAAQAMDAEEVGYLCLATTQVGSSGSVSGSGNGNTSK